MLTKFAAALFLSLTALPVAAQDFEQIDGWAVAQVRAGVCQMAAPFQGSTYISFIASDTKVGMIVLVGSDWKLEDGNAQAMKFSWDGWRTTQEVSANVKLSSSGRTTIGTPVEIAVNQSIRRARKLAIRIPTAGIDSEISFPEGALKLLTECLARP